MNPDEQTIKAKLRHLSDAEYPDNPDNSIRHPAYNKLLYSVIEFRPRPDSLYDIKISGTEADTIQINAISLDEFIPVACESVRNYPYLQYIALINQEWNRHQVAFTPEQFEVRGSNDKGISRVDIARNCLNAGLWEVIMFADSGGNALPIHHSWFDFPKEKYAHLFELRNHIAYEKYKKPLENWVTPENKIIQLSDLRKMTQTDTINFYSHNSENYPLRGERKKKFPNIIYPKNTTRISDFLTDSTRFATFSPPGIYTTADPRKTELSRLSNPILWVLRKIKTSRDDKRVEIEIVFNPEEASKKTRLIISGLNLEEIPLLDTTEANKGWQNSMGFGNHSFYETYEKQQSYNAFQNPYFCILTTEDYFWLDSHEIGIDGPLLHFDSKDPNRLHIWILSFERHAFVGHYSAIINHGN